MRFVNLALSPYGSYSYEKSSSIKMDILGLFLTSSVGYAPCSFREWGLTNRWENDETNGNVTALERNGDYILLRDLFSDEEVPTVLKMTREQYGQILTDWEEKVLKLKPKEVIITYENDQFVIETKD